jgi:Flp pilus assembly protein TadG
MMTLPRKSKGSVLIMVTVALVAMFGIMGLAVDFGWAYFVKKSAQSAADAAALAAVSAAMDAPGPASSISCGTATCAATPIPCPASGNLAIGCQYAAQNGFSPATARQNVLIQASDAATAPTVTGCVPAVQHPPTAPCVDTIYWVTVRVSEQVPQLFSAVMGRYMATVSARATAAVAQSEAIGSLILLNRENDIWAEATGRNFHNNGGPTVNVPGGIVLASSTAGAGYAWGNTEVVTPFTWVRPSGTVITGGSATWGATPGTNTPPVTRADGSPFYDPFRDDLQLPVSPSSTNIPVPQSNSGVAELSNVCTVCEPGNYYAAVPNGSGGWTPTGNPITINPGNGGAISFQGSGPAFSSGSDFTFFGGARVQSGQLTMGAGRYVFAGVNTSGASVFSIDNGVRVIGGNGASSDPGRAFVFTDGSYGGRLDTARTNIAGMPTLQYGPVNMQAGQNASSGVDLYGINPAHPDVQAAGIDRYPVVMWQDRANSTCGSYTLDTACTTPRGNRPELAFQATPHTHYGGVIYQPRGAWTSLQGGGNYTGALQIITGAMKLGGNGNLVLTSPSTPVTTLVAALVE